MVIALRPFQRRFIASALAPGIDTAALSLPRGNGKSWLAAHLLTRCLTPGDPLHIPGSEYLLCAGSIEQARLCYRFVRTDLEPRGGYRFLDSFTRIGVTHTATNTRLRVLSSNGKTAMGIVGLIGQIRPETLPPVPSRRPSGHIRRQDPENLTGAGETAASIRHLHPHPEGVIRPLRFVLELLAPGELGARRQRVDAWASHLIVLPGLVASARPVSRGDRR